MENKSVLYISKLLTVNSWKEISSLLITKVIKYLRGNVIPSLIQLFHIACINHNIKFYPLNRCNYKLLIYNKNKHLKWIIIENQYITFIENSYINTAWRNNIYFLQLKICLAMVIILIVVKYKCKLVLV